ncbi:hypothetical protein ACFY2K_08190 [Kitasatospora sp. NPDC001309]|uniref:restriction system modified-DNA reader domain-containing protein n=1 Tax=Kitasatospora sp. NPDC001309 TaxID=3364013 RepID=UPI0036B15788
MRHIDANGLIVTTQWEEKAAKIRKRIEDCAGDVIEIKKILDKESHWTKLRPQLVKLCGRKCWYCEGVVKHSRLPVDHFRPKGKVAGTSHAGYYWLAYSPLNFRLACEFCNSSTDDDPSGKRNSKHNHFPLLNELARVASPDLDISREMPVLLDPFLLADCELLSFSTDGTARRGKPRSPLESVDRVAESIRIYSLDRPGLDDGRKKVMDAVVWNAEYLNRGLSEFAEKIRELISIESEYSSAALAALRTTRDLPVIAEKFGDELAVDDDARTGGQPIVDTDVNLSLLIESGFLRPGVELIGEAALGEVVATLLPDGRIQVGVLGVRSYASPESAAAAAGAEASSGWQFWKIEVNSGRVPIAEIRDSYVSARS